MPSIPRGQENTTSDINWFTSINGVKTDMYLVEFQIFCIEAGLPGTQIFPLSGWEDVTDAPGRFAEGSYYAYDNTQGQGWTPDVTSDLGTYRIYWRWKYLSTSSYQTGEEDFEVLVESTGAPGTETMYCTVQDLRDEGVPTSYSDSYLETIIQRVSRDIDRYTGRWFEARSLSYTLDGSGTVALLLEQPIISITEVQLDGVAYASSDLIVYNRHITQGLLSPDDRENPKIEIRQPYDDDLLFKFGLTWFPKGQQNMQVEGVFGYTDYDGSSQGYTPLAIKQAAKMMAIRELTPLYNADPTDERSGAWWRITSQRTRDQAITYANPVSLGSQGVGPFTGDPRIDNILLRYCAPLRLRSV
jgi:hypothetical protein